MKKVTAHILSASIIFLPLLVFGQGTKDIGLKNPVGVNSVSELILIVVRVIRYMAIPFVVIAIMYSGYLFIWAQVTSNAKTLQKAKDTLLYVIIGAFIILSSELIALVMKNTITGLSN